MISPVPRLSKCTLEMASVSVLIFRVTKWTLMNRAETSDKTLELFVRIPEEMMLSTLSGCLFGDTKSKSLVSLLSTKSCFHREWMQALGGLHLPTSFNIFSDVSEGFIIEAYGRLCIQRPCIHPHSHYTPR